MKKMISAILAVASIACTTSVFAAEATGQLTEGARNDVYTMPTASTSAMPGLRGGDIIKFNVDSLTTGNELTVISYKLNGGDLKDKNIQYVDQYTIDADTKTIEYIVRDTTVEGIYQLDINGNDGAGVKSFFYKVGNPVIEVMQNTTDNTGYWNFQPYEVGESTFYAAGYVARVKMGSPEINLKDMGYTSLGLKLTANGVDVTASLTSEQFDALSNASSLVESDGTVTFAYGRSVYGMTSVTDAQGITAEVVYTENEQDIR